MDESTTLEHLKRELRAAELAVAALTRELIRAIEAPTPVDMTVIDGTILVLLSNGALRRHRTRARGTLEGKPTGWEVMEPVPGTAASIVEEALHAGREFGGMSVVG